MSDDQFDRVPPQDIDAEMSVLGSMMLTTDAVHGHVHILWITCAQRRLTLCTGLNDRSVRADMLITVTSL